MELMITVAIVSVLAGIAIPSYIGWLPKRHLQSSAVDVQVAINLAKHTAIRENTDVVLTFDRVNNSYLAFIDNNLDGVIDATDENGSQDAGERTLRSKSMAPGINLLSTTWLAPDDVLIFNSRGLADNSGDVNLKNKREETRTVQVAITGSTRIIY